MNVVLKNLYDTSFEMCVISKMDMKNVKIKLKNYLFIS
jgi:hypothetical protein